MCVASKEMSDVFLPSPKIYLPLKGRGSSRMRGQTSFVACGTGHASFGAARQDGRVGLSSAQFSVFVFSCAAAPSAAARSFPNTHDTTPAMSAPSAALRAKAAVNYAE